MALHNIFTCMRTSLICIAMVASMTVAGSTAYAENKDELASEIQKQIATLLLEQAIEKQAPIKTPMSVTGLGSCRNTQILSYSPISGSSQTSLSEFIFNVKDTTKVSSLELTINDASYPVQYTKSTDGSYRARVINLENLTGNLYISMGAQSENPSACNDLLLTSFTVKKEQAPIAATNILKADPIVVTGQVSTKPENTLTKKPFDTNVEVEMKKPSTISVTKLDEEVLDEINQNQEETIISNDKNTSRWPWSWFGSSDNDMDDDELVENSVNELSTVSTSSLASSSNELIAQATSATATIVSLSEEEKEVTKKAAQAALLFGLINKDIEKCSTVGAGWSWFVWLGIIWLWLIAVWVAISFYAEPVFGTASYTRRLTWIMFVSALIGIALWYITNPCFTHAWLPATFVGLSILLHWLYSEDSEVA